MATRAEKRIAAAKKRLVAAEARISAAVKAMRDAESAAIRRTSPAVRAASRKRLDAQIALTIAELAAVGIEPMKTIVRWKGRDYAVRIDPKTGYDCFVPVGKRDRVMEGRNEVIAPYQLRGVEVTDRTLIED